MSERDEIADVIGQAINHFDPESLGTWEETASWNTFDALRALFAEKPWLANALLPEGYAVFGRDDIPALKKRSTGRARTIHRSSVRGRFISEEEAEANPETTEREEVKR